MRRRWKLSAALAILFGTLTAPGAGGEILGEKSFWRTCVVSGSELVKTDDGKLVRISGLSPTRRAGRSKSELNRVAELERVPAPPPPEWTSPDFDDSSWGRFRTPLGGPTSRGKQVRLCPGSELLYLRGAFEITDPARAGDMRLSVTYRGGIVVYLNGKELTRAHLPKGKVTPDTAAEEYPSKAFFAAGGKRIKRKDRKKHAECFKVRDRTLSGVKVPAGMLRKGLNVLAIEVHRSPMPARIYTESRSYEYVWGRLAVLSARLTGGAGGGVPRSSGMRVWNCSMVQRVNAAMRGVPGKKLHPVRMSAARNGAHSGQVVVSSGKAIRGLKATASDLTGPGKIPASAIQVRWGLPDGPSGYKGPLSFDGLALFPPEEVPVRKGEDGDGAVQPVWITVKVPAEAKAGKYAGKVTLSAQGEQPVDVPVEVEVLPFTLPDPQKFQLFVGIIQSPDSVAMQYKVPMWSEKHWKLMEKSFELMAQVGVKTIYIPVLRRTHFGNPHTMVRWVKNGKGYSRDFSIVERYLDLAVKHLGKIPVVCLYCWEKRSSSGRWGNSGAVREDRDVHFSVLDPATKKLEEATGPDGGHPQAAGRARAG